MYNTDIPIRAELPTTAQLIKSTVIALVAAIVLLVTIVLPSEHAIDPTGVGRILKLTEMGEIKKQLAAEAEADRIKDQQQNHQKPQSGLLSRVATWIIPSAQAQTAAKRDELTITLKPTEGVEYKMTMVKGAKVNFNWKVQGGSVNYDMHGTPSTKIETSYKKGREVAEDAGILEAKFDGTHGWFWRNRGTQAVTITLKVDGTYSEIKKM